MEIEEAFTEEAMDAADTRLEEDMVERLRAFVREIYAENDLEITAAHESAALLLFVGGCTWQANQESIAATVMVPMDGELVGAFIQFLRERI